MCIRITQPNTLYHGRLKGLSKGNCDNWQFAIYLLTAEPSPHLGFQYALLQFMILSLGECGKHRYRGALRISIVLGDQKRIKRSSLAVSVTRNLGMNKVSELSQTGNKM